MMSVYCDLYSLGATNASLGGNKYRLKKSRATDLGPCKNILEIPLRERHFTRLRRRRVMVLAAFVLLRVVGNKNAVDE